MLQLSYFVAAGAMIAAALYLLFRLRPYLTTTTMLIMSLLLIYGPAFLSFTLTSGEYAFWIRRILGLHGGASDVWLEMATKIPDFRAVITAMNFSVALMYISIIAGIEMVGWLAAKRLASYSAAVADWNNQNIQDSGEDARILLSIILALSLFMLFISFKENHLATIKHFFTASAEGNERFDLRLHHSGSPNYLYNLILGAVAPMVVVWGALVGWLRRSWPLLTATLVLFIAVSIGKVDSLSKAPPAFFLLQLMLAVYLTRTNRLTWRSFLAAAIIIAIVIYSINQIVVEIPNALAALESAYSRVFEAESESLLEYFATFPRVLPFLGTANIRPLAALMHMRYDPSFSMVPRIWHPGADPSYTNPSLFIADAWAGFSYAGVVVYSIVAGAICRFVDLLLLARGKSTVGIAVLCATFIGIVTLLTTALNTALVSGGLLLAPTAAILVLAASRCLTRKPSSAWNGFRH